MAIIQDFKAFHQSIAYELKATKDRIRHLIGNHHWLTDGEYKESILRKIFSTHLPESVRIGTGFVCYPNTINNDSDNSASSQLDILITDRNYPTLYKQGDLNFVTPNCVRAIIEVKTKLYKKRSSNNVKDVLNKLSNQVEIIRKNSGNEKSIWVGLFVYEHNPKIDEQYFLEILKTITEEKPQRIINCVTWGNHIFIRFWQDGKVVGSPVAGPVWHLYNLESLAPAYFLSNLVLELSNSAPDDYRPWFPENTKEVFRIAVKPFMNEYKHSNINNYTLFNYKTNDDRFFKFRLLKLNTGYEIDILEMPDYGDRPKVGHITHRKVTSRGCKKISWNRVIPDEATAKNIASNWADKTCNYIVSGTEF